VDKTLGTQIWKLLHVVNKHEACTIETIGDQQNARYAGREMRMKRRDEKYKQTRKCNDEAHPDLDEQLEAGFTLLIFGMTAF